VNRLVLRVKQLVLLLKKANISIPTGPYIQSLVKKRKKHPKSPEDVENKRTKIQKDSPAEKEPPITSACKILCYHPC